MFHTGGEDQRFILEPLIELTHGVLYYTEHTFSIEHICKDQRFILEPLIQLTHRERGGWKAVSVLHRPNALICVSHLLLLLLLLLLLFLLSPSLSLPLP
jgi:hypothetical protein